MTLDQLPVGHAGIITKVGGNGPLRCRLLDMGLIPKTKVLVKKVAPMGDPIELHLRGYTLTLRKDDAADIEIDPIEPSMRETPGERSPGKGGHRR